MLPSPCSCVDSQEILWNSWWDTSSLRQDHGEWRSRAVRTSPISVSIYRKQMLDHIAWIYSNIHRDLHCAVFIYLLFWPFLGSLSALVYQHSITPISLPCALRIPEKGWISIFSSVRCRLHPSKQSFVFLMTDVWCFRPGWGTPGDKECNQHQHCGRPPQTGRRLEPDVLRLWYSNPTFLQHHMFTLTGVFSALIN